MLKKINGKRLVSVFITLIIFLGVFLSIQATVLAVTPPAAPSNLRAEYSTTEVCLHWYDASDDEAGFVVERRLNGGSWGVLKALDANISSYRDTTVVAGKTYQFRVYAYKLAVSPVRIIYSEPSEVLTIPIPAQSLYRVTVNYGSGSGNYAPGTTVTIEADPPPPGGQFNSWGTEGVTLSYPNAKRTSFTMPTNDVTVTARYLSVPVVNYKVTVNNGTADNERYMEGEAVTIKANNPPSGKVFDRWTSSGITLSNPESLNTTFTMPGNDVTVTATYKDVKYTVTVNKGTGSDSYTAGATVTIKADAPPAGKIFDKWNITGVTLSYPTDSETTFTMPGNNVTVTATYKDLIKYTVTVNGGTGSGNYIPGVTVIIKADAAPEGKTFDSWSASGVILSDPKSKTITFAMPSNNVILTAVYKDLATDIIESDDAEKQSEAADTTGQQPERQDETGVSADEKRGALNGTAWVWIVLGIAIGLAAGAVVMLLIVKNIAGKDKKEQDSKPEHQIQDELYQSIQLPESNSNTEQNLQLQPSVDKSHQEITQTVAHEPSSADTNS